MPRLPRFKRASAVAPFDLTSRDREIMRLVQRYRFLRSVHLVTLLGDSRQQILRRLKLLYHHGFLERPHCQLEYYSRGGSRHIVYGLGNKGAKVSKQADGRAVRWEEMNRSVGRIYLEHALMVSDVMVAIELACRQNNVRLVSAEELAKDGESKSFRWKVGIKNGTKLGVIPDMTFALEYPAEDSTCKRTYFFLEADRGTMPIKRRNLSQTSIYRKLLAYAATWKQSLHQTLFGFHRFRVLTITTSSERLQSLIEACSTLKQGHGLFLFADIASISNPSGVLSDIWQTPKQGQTVRLFD